MTTFGLGDTFLYLVKGLLAGASSEVHVNGHFTKEIPITRGVHQGCPLSPLIFSLSTQPLMDYLQVKQGSGELDGVRILDNLTICHHLFADNIGVIIPTTEESSNKLQTILKLYKTVFGAKLNVSKSIIIPLVIPTTPPWLANTSCKISASGKVQKYLGSPIGRNLKSSQLHDFCLDRISKRRKGWANGLLSFTGRVLLIQHVLQSISIYHMMYIETPIGTTKYINCLLKDFLWGTFEDGSTWKIPLITWKRLT